MSFTIDKKKLTPETNAIEQSGQLSVDAWLQGRQEVKAADSLQVNMKARVQANGFVVDSDCAVMLEHVCSKCLRSFTEHLEFSFREQFANSAEAANEEEDIHYAARDEVDMLPFIEEHFQLSLPYAAVCSTDCLGLCAVCGGNRNEHACDCKVELIDPRLAGLQDFFNK